MRKDELVVPVPGMDNGLKMDDESTFNGQNDVAPGATRAYLSIFRPSMSIFRPSSIFILPHSSFILQKKSPCTKCRGFFAEAFSDSRTRLLPDLDLMSFDITDYITDGL